MTGVAITVTVDDAPVRAVLGKLRELDGDAMLPAMQEIGAQLVQHVEERFDDSRGPGGVPWQPSQRAREEGGKTLVDTGRLRDSITFQATAREVSVGTNVLYAAIHQLGATIDRPARQATIYQRVNKAGELQRLFVPKSRSNFARDVEIGAHTIDMPARPFLGFDAVDRDEVLHIVQDHIARITAAAGGAP